ncbi:MAG TPA: ankyrin repeat domain-containing protein [Pyrinomonadaceae bacterium]|nr:ankyrin repeat domain-containing protein [Pyrinomonadaceae bacterium]
MSPKKFLDSVTIPSPCNADWNSMIGNDQVRFCDHCSLDVHNLSLMTRNQAQKLVARSNGRLCVRYHSDSSGRPQTLPLSQKLHHINRRVSRIAAGAFTATLSLTNAMAQGSASPTSGDANSAQITRESNRWSAGATISGTIADQHGAVIQGATIYLSNAESGLGLFSSSASDGQFKIEGLKSGFYKLRVEAPGFAADQTDELYLMESRELRADRTLHVAEIAETVDVESEAAVTFIQGGAVAFVAPEHPFVRAAQESDLDALTALIAGADVNVRDKRTGTTALEHAVKNAYREMVQLLLSSGAKVNLQNDAGETALMMIDEDATSDLIWDLVNAGADLKLKDKHGNTTLIEIADTNNLDALRTLLDAGADVNAKNADGETALMRAASEGLVNNVRALVLAGADLNAVDNEKVNALAHALNNDHQPVARFLKSKGAVEKVAQVQKEKE